MDGILKILKKQNSPRASSAPALELNTCTIIFKHVFWYKQQISGERLQDHWSSGCLLFQFSFFLLSFVYCPIFMYMFCFRDSDIENQPVPGSRLLHQTNHRRNHLNHRLASIENTETNQEYGTTNLEPDMIPAHQGITKTCPCNIQIF